MTLSRNFDSARDDARGRVDRFELAKDFYLVGYVGTHADVQRVRDAHPRSMETAPAAEIPAANTPEPAPVPRGTLRTKLS